MAEAMEVDAVNSRSVARQIGLDDLPGTWRVDVQRVWIGASMKKSFGAVLLVKDDRSKRWRRLGKTVVSDDGPIQAVSDLLSALDLGVLQ